MPMIVPPFGDFSAIREGRIAKKEWYDNMIGWFWVQHNNGFNLSTDEITAKLNVTSRYLKERLNPEVDYVNAHAMNVVKDALGCTIEGESCPIVYYNREQYNQWLQRHCICSRQTYACDVTELYPHITLEAYKEAYDNELASVGKVVVNKLIERFLLGYGLRSEHGRPDYIHRNTLCEAPVAFDLTWFSPEDKGELRFPKDRRERPELFYREMVKLGAIKISLEFDGKGSKTIYYVEPRIKNHFYVALRNGDQLIRVI